MGPYEEILQPLDRLRRDAVSKALLNGLEHQVSDHLAADAAGAGTPGDDFSITGIQRKSDAYDLAVPTGDLEAIRGPSQIGSDRDDLAIVSTTWRLPRVSL